VRTSLARAALVSGALCGAPSAGVAQAAPAQRPVEVVGGRMPRPLTGNTGDPARGRELVLSRERANCIVCHAIPAPDEASHGNLGPSLRGVANRFDQGQMRLRLVDARQLNASSIMPSYYRMDGLKRVAAAYAGKPVLSAQEIEDVLAFLMTLREDQAK
jgi:L-cysteine S-thiosulfotransferase